MAVENAGATENNDNTNVSGVENQQTTNSSEGSTLTNAADSEVPGGETLEGAKGANSEQVIAAGPPEEYADFGAPEGTTLSGDDMKSLKDEARTLGLNQENAQKYVEQRAQQVKAAGDQQNDAWGKIRTDWVNELKNDNEFGGQGYTETITRAKRVIASFGGDATEQAALGEYFVKLGMGDNPNLIKMLARIDKATGENTSVGGADHQGSRSAADIMMGDMVQN